MKRIVLCLLVAASGLAKDQEPLVQRPACKAAIHGQFWPPAANTDPKAARALSQCGALEVCTTTTWRYKWQPVTVNVRQLGKTPQQPTPACIAVMSEFGETSAVSRSTPSN